MNRIGYVGLGDMGGALARRLQLSKPLTVYDLNQQAIERLTNAGAKPSTCLQEMAAECDTIFLCLPTTAHVRKAIFGEKGLKSKLSSGTLIVDQTTGNPSETQAMAEELEKIGVELIDAPVSGGAVGAAAGTIAIMVGATSSQFERAQPLFSAISSNVFHIGKVGSGQVIKLVNNMISGAQRLLTFEGMALAAKSGIDPRKACAVLAAGGAKNAFIEKVFRQEILAGDLERGFTLELMHKDIRLACDMGANLNVPMFYGNLTKELYQLCMSHVGPDPRVNHSGRVFDKIAGTHMVPESAKQ